MQALSRHPYLGAFSIVAITLLVHVLDELVMPALEVMWAQPQVTALADPGDPLAAVRHEPMRR